MIAIRVSKVVLVLAAGLYCLLVGYDNIVDYGSNFAFVQHVMSMDTTFPGNAVRDGRAVLDPRLHHLAYAIIIASLGVILLIAALEDRDPPDDH